MPYSAQYSCGCTDNNEARYSDLAARCPVHNELRVRTWGGSRKALELAFGPLVDHPTFTIVVRSYAG